MSLAGKYGLLVLVAGSVIALDQGSKLYVDSRLALYDTRALIPGFFDLHYIRNTGAAFGFLSRADAHFRVPFFIGVSLVATAILLYLFHRFRRADRWLPIAFSLVLGGALGNLIDRIRLGEVIDFFYVHYKSFHWPAFNVADVAISVGVFLLVLRMAVLEKVPSGPRGSSICPDPGENT